MNAAGHSKAPRGSSNTSGSLGRSHPTGIPAEFRDELRITCIVPGKVLPLGWFAPAAPRHWKEPGPALGAAFCLPCSETLNRAGASRTSSPGCYGRMKKSPKTQGCTFAANGSHVWLPVGLQLVSLTIPQPRPAKKLWLFLSLMKRKSQTWK